MKQAVVLRTGVANIASVLAALRRLDVHPELTEDPDAVRSADIAVLPGVGAFAAGAEILRRFALDEALRERLRADRPTLAVCLGMQLLFEESEESPGVRGLGIFPGRVEKFSVAPKVPQLGWNRIEAEKDCCILRSGAVYFANSYCVKQRPIGIPAATAEYSEKFVAGLERGALLACQFHPELSGEVGGDILRRWLDRARGGLA
jgi:imidazole glycerol phosphate synthase glutamine amidotransferase subunit